MNRLPITVVLLSLALVSCSHVHRRDEPESVARTKCEELCAKDSGIDADGGDCKTECAVSTDLMTHHLDQGYEDFTRDEAYNEKGGQKMKEAHNEKAPEEVPSCIPEEGYDASTIPEFDTLDINRDGVIDGDEAFTFGEKACIPDEMVGQLFSEADLNQDKVIEKNEWKAGGEDTKNEQAMDEALEKVSQGDDESNTVQNPPMTEFDKNNDGSLDEDESKDVFEHELGRRTEHEPIPEDTMKELEPKIDEAVEKVDTNDDGAISGDEYAAKGDANDLGDELQEAASADEDKPELDDLSRADGAAAPAPAGLLSHHSQLRRGHKVSPRKIKYAEAILAKAKFQQHLRHAMFVQHQQRLRQAALLHKKARAFRHRK